MKIKSLQRWGLKALRYKREFELCSGSDVRTDSELL